MQAQARQQNNIERGVEHKVLLLEEELLVTDSFRERKKQYPLTVVPGWPSNAMFDYVLVNTSHISLFYFVFFIKWAHRVGAEMQRMVDNVNS